MQGQLPSVPYNISHVQNAMSALDHLFEVQLSLTRSKISKAQEPVATSYQNHRAVPETLRKGWPHKGLQVMQSMDELQAQMVREDEQHKFATQAFEVDYMQRMIQYQKRLRSLKLENSEAK